MINNKPRLNANKTDSIIIGTSRQHSKLTHYFPTNILSHSITPSDTVPNLGVTFYSDFNFRKHISPTCRSSFYHIRDLRRIRPYISLSVAKTIATALITSRLASKDILKLQCVQNCLAKVVTRSPRFSHSLPLLKSLHCMATCSNLASFSNSALLLISNSFFWRTLISIFHAFFSTQAQRAPFIWFSLVVCSQG